MNLNPIPQLKLNRKCLKWLSKLLLILMNLHFQNSFLSLLKLNQSELKLFLFCLSFIFRLIHFRLTISPLILNTLKHLIRLASLIKIYILLLNYQLFKNFSKINLTHFLLLNLLFLSLFLNNLIFLIFGFFLYINHLESKASLRIHKVLIFLSKSCKSILNLRQFILVLYNTFFCFKKLKTSIRFSPSH